MNDEECSICEECWVKYQKVSVPYLMRKLKCDSEYAAKVKAAFQEYIGIVLNNLEEKGT
jgi:hypothetical protein